ncbi:protein LATERAL ROOT PRIMORDIUM 1 [Rutidosis leptorrhynchoides]|uniref:protein LATERAL ROOT PRIMORDIUM 1 n=1 Tax=Rutidosis leptorrhynchoides TaxID=125765 RepID=UPI003A9A2453
MGMFVVAPSTHHLSDHMHAHHSLNSTVAGGTALGVGVIPLLTATPAEDTVGNHGGGGGGRVSNVTIASSSTNNNNSSSAQFWQPQQSYFRKNMISDHGLGGGGCGTGSTLTCQDCGNQAKKDCNHRRCRTCCKSRGFDCATHVKSTWVPAARRRERQLMTSTGAASSASTSGSKKPRLITSRTTTPSHTSTSNNNTPPRSFETSSSAHHQDASFMQSLPAQVRAPAVFKCVRVTAVEEGDDEYAYQASVTIGGHTFKGFLYDQGVETRDHNSIHNLSELHLGGSSGRNVGGSMTSLPLDTPTVYGSSGGGLLG